MSILSPFFEVVDKPIRVSIADSDKSHLAALKSISQRSVRIGMIFLLAMLTFTPLLLAADKSEDELIQMLKARDYKVVSSALEKLPKLYPDSTNSLPYIRELLKSNDVVSKEKKKTVPPNILARKAARALGEYHAALGPDDLKLIYGFLKARDSGEVIDGLKALRGLKAPDAVPEILPLLKDTNEHIIRDSIRTLAALGNKETIPAIEPFLQHSNPAVKKDAQEALAALQAKP